MPDTTLREPETIALSITRVFDAPPALVFRVWSAPEHLVRWWGPKDFTVPTFKADFREGGAWRSCIRSPEGTDYWCNGVYREIAAPDRLVFSFRWEEENSLDTVVTVTFEDVGGRTRLTFHQAPYRSVEDRDGHLEGWGECIDRLEAYVDATKGDTA